MALLLTGIVTGWFSDWLAPFVIPPVLTLMWSLDAMNDVENDGLWPVGAMMVFVGTTAATLVLVLVGQAPHQSPHSRCTTVAGLIHPG